MIRYCLQLSIISISLLSSIASTENPQGKGCGRVFQSLDTTGYIFCQASPPFANVFRGFDISFKLNDWIRVDGLNSPSLLDFHLKPLPGFSGVKKMIIAGCELPKEKKLFDIAHQISAKNITELILQLKGDLGRNLLVGFEKIDRLTLDNSSLTNVPTDWLHHLKNLTVLNLRESNLREIPRDFLNLPNLKSTELNGNHIEIIESAAFDRLTTLEVLNIASNRIVEIKANSFDNLESLVSLDLHLNQLTQLPENIFGKLRSLRFINLSQNNFTGDSLSGHLLRNNNLLEAVTFVENKWNLTTLPFQFFANLKKLTIVEMRRNGLTQLPADLFVGASGLKHLSMKENYIETLPHHFFNDCENLISIDLSFNEIRELPEGILSILKKLELLDLSGNHITIIREEIFHDLPSLKILNLESNGLQIISTKSLPENISVKPGNIEPVNSTEHDSLPEILTRNNILIKNMTSSENGESWTRPIFLANFSKFTIVNISNNGLIYLPENLLTGAESLRNLSMERNYIETIPQNFFKDCRNLSTIDLSWNRLRSLPDDIFSTLDKLELLDLSRNHITEIGRNIFSGLSFLKVLNLENNELTTIDQMGMRSLKNLRIAKFSSNQLVTRGFAARSPFYHCMKTIEELYLAHNNFTEIAGDWHWPKNLRILDLRYNHLWILPAYELLFQSKRIKVDLSFNKIKTILLEKIEKYAQDDTDLQNITISVENNPIICNCDMYDPLRYREGRMHTRVYERFQIHMTELRCHQPDWLTNVTIEQLESKSLKCLVENPKEYNARCPEKCECWMRVDDRSYIIDCSSRGLTDAPKILVKPSGYRQIELNLTGNSLATMPDITQPGYDAVTVLSLSRNQITEVPLTRLSKNLRVLSLDSNRLRRLDASVLGFLMYSKSLENLSLQGNSWSADCDARKFLSFIQTKMTTIPGLREVTFESSESPAFQMTPAELCPPEIGWIIGISVGVALLGLIVAALAVCYYHYQHQIKVWLYTRHWCLWFVSEDELDKDKLYDAFISYSHKDEDFVLNNLIMKLEGGSQPFKLCVHYRDWKAGEWIAAQIARSVEDSRRTIVVLSPNFMESVWGKMEFRTAHTQALNEGRTRIIIILYGEIGPIDQLEPELKAYLSMNTYIKWGDPWFWDKLRYALPHSESFGRKKRKPTVFETQQPGMQTIGEKGGYIDESKSKN